MNAVKTFFTAHKSTIMIASAALVIGAKSVSYMAQNSQAPIMNMPNQQQMMQHSMPAQQMPQGYNQQMPQQQAPGFFDSWFGGNEEVADYNAYNSGAGQGAYYGANAGGGYNPSAGATTGYTTGGGADYTNGWAEQQRMQDGSHERFVDAMREETKYGDAEGNTYKLSSGYDYNYVNSSTNEYVQTNDASVTPGAYSSYTAVSPVDYTSSSSTSSSGE
jgi:hypothetical protein